MEIDWYALLKMWLVVGPLLGFGALELLIHLRDRRRAALSQRTLEPMTRVDDPTHWWNRPGGMQGGTTGWWNRPPAEAAAWDRRRRRQGAGRP